MRIGKKKNARVPRTQARMHTDIIITLAMLFRCLKNLCFRVSFFIIPLFSKRGVSLRSAISDCTRLAPDASSQHCPASVVVDIGDGENLILHRDTISFNLSCRTPNGWLQARRDFRIGPINSKRLTVPNRAPIQPPRSGVACKRCWAAH